MERPETVDMQRSTRDLSVARARLEAWLRTQEPAADIEVGELTAPSANGMSSETLLFDLTRTVDGRQVTEPMVARVAPEPTAVPVFPVYDLDAQFRAMRVVSERTGVPVPHVYWSEPTGQAIGSACFVMERIEGQVPPDVMPYVFGDNWLYDADPADQARLQSNSIGVLADLHAIPDAPAAFPFLGTPGTGTALRRHVDAHHAFYAWATEGGFRSPRIEQCLAWMEEHWPADDGDAVLSWGDSRIGNMMYRDFTPVAVLDWEMASVGPREIDLAWMIWMHRAFQDMATGWGMAGMPSFMQPADVLTEYERRSGHTPRDLEFFLMYAAVRWATVMIRTGRRSIHFGESERPEDIDDLTMTKAQLEAMLAGTYWDF